MHVQQVVDEWQTTLRQTRAMEATRARVSEPGRTPLEMVVHLPLEVGRECSGLLLSDALLSRRHLRVSATEGPVTVEDLGSTNGTLVDGVAVKRPTPVQPGQLVTFGHCLLEVLRPVRSAAVPGVPGSVPK